VSPLELGTVTVSEIVVACDADALVPLTTMLYVPAAAVPVAIVSVELPPAVMVDEENDALAPAGRPLAESATLCAAPDVTVVEIVLVAVAPWSAVTAVGLALMAKSAGAVTVRVTVVACVSVVPVAVTVSG
jgi:hypothetical protein